MRSAADAVLSRSLQAIEKRFESELEASKVKIAKLEVSLKSRGSSQSLAELSSEEVARLKQECQDLMQMCA
jgi:Skp family chaperone for outer membrane proteins